MGYIVEVSFDTRKHKNISELKYNLKEISYNCGGDGGIFLQEFEENKKTNTSNKFIFISNFEKKEQYCNKYIDSYYNPDFEYLFLHHEQPINISQEAKNCQLFIHKIRMIKNILLETIYTSQPCILLYASKRFLTRINKKDAENYLNHNKIRRLSDEEELLVNTIINK
jgi:hypothetical protein